MDTFTANFRDPATLVMLIFIMATLMAYSNGASYGATTIIGGLGQLFLLPLSIASSLSAGLPILAPLFVLGFLWLLAKLRAGLGEAVQAAIIVCAVVLILHA